MAAKLLVFEFAKAPKSPSISMRADSAMRPDVDAFQGPAALPGHQPVARSSAFCTFSCKPLILGEPCQRRFANNTLILLIISGI
jgi:hypothetical protein